MMIKVSSLFGQILSEIFSSVDFEKLVVKHKAELRAKGFRSRTQLISMLFCHLARADSLRGVRTFFWTVTPPDPSFEGEDVYRDERERASDPDLDSPCPPGGLLFDVPDGTSNSPCLHARAQVASSSVTGSVVLLEHGDDAAAEPFHLPGFASLAERTVRDAS